MNRNYCVRAGKSLSHKPAAAYRLSLRAVLAAFVLVLCQAAISSIGAQDSITGQWILSTRTGTEYAHLTVQRRTDRHSNFMSSLDIRGESIRGLTREQMAGSGSAVQFQIVRAAGTLNCEGWFKDGRGSGHFVFTPNQNYIASMRGLGYDDLSTEKVFALAVHDVSLEFIQELSAAGYSRVSVDKLLAMRIHGVSMEFINELKSAGYDQVPVDKLVAMRIHGVSTSFVKELQEMGYERPAIDKLVAMRIHGVKTEFIKELRDLGYERVPIDQLVAMRIHGVTAAFIEKMRQRGFNDLSVEKLISLRIHGFDR